MEKEMKLAVLIDAENIASKYINVILGEANNLGNVIYKRIYGNWTTPQMSSWKDIILDNSIQPIQQYSYTTGKNSTDSSLIIDAMDLLYLGRLDGFCIVSSDSDFTRLAARLREAEMFVLGMGEQKTPRSFISACNKFSYLDLLFAAGSKDAPVSSAVKEGPRRAAEPAAGNQAAAPKKSAPESAPSEKDGSNLALIRQTLRELAEENSDDDGWIFSGKLGYLLNKQFPDFDVRNFSCKKFGEFVETLGLFDTLKVPGKDNVASNLVYYKLL